MHEFASDNRNPDSRSSRCMRRSGLTNVGEAQLVAGSLSLRHWPPSEKWLESLPLTARFGVIEYDGRDEEKLAEAVDLTRKMRDVGLDLLDVSIGFSTNDAKVPWGPGTAGPGCGTGPPRERGCCGRRLRNRRRSGC
jgi:hypothetical protein